MNGTNDRGDTTPVIRAPDDSDVEMETQDEVHQQQQQNHTNSTCNGRNGSSNGYQNGNSHTICEDGYEDEDDDMGERKKRVCVGYYKC